MNFGSTQKVEQPITPTHKAVLDNGWQKVMDTVNFALQNEYIPPTASYIVGANGMVKWGHDNLFPLQLADLLNSSPMHQSIIKMKSDLVTGSGIQFKNYSGLTPEQQTELTKFVNVADGCDKSLSDVASELSLDFQIFGAMALEVIWDLTFTKIIKINRIPMVNLRMHEENAIGKIEKFYFNKNWTRPNQYGTYEIPAFNISDRTNTNQLLYIKNPSVDGRYYGVPAYSSGLNWVAADAAISKFHLSNISHGMAPSLKIQFYKTYDSPEQRDEIVRGIERQYASQHNAGRAMIFFSDGKDYAPSIEPIQVNNIDKQFVTIANQIVQQILRAHRGVSGVLFGISTSNNKLSLQGEYENAFKIFTQIVVAPDRKILENVLNKVLKLNGIDAGLYFDQIQIFNGAIG